MNVTKWLVMVALIATMGYGRVLGDVRMPQTLTGDEPLPDQVPIPYNGVRHYLPGSDSIIGTTAYDYQANGGFGTRLMVDDLGQTHVDWMWQDYPGQTERRCYWNARFADGTFYGASAASPSWSGYVALAVTSDGRTVVAYHYNPGTGYYSWIDIDGGSLWGTFMANPRSPMAADQIWPHICVAGDNIIMVSIDYSGVPVDHRWITTDEGLTWSGPTSFDSIYAQARFVRASPNSDKVVHVWTRAMETTILPDYTNDVMYDLSTDNGATWSGPVNITNYRSPADMHVPGDSAVWANNTACAVFDANDNLHIAWAAFLAYVDSDTVLNFIMGGKIFHWDEVSNTIHTVSSPSVHYYEPGGWWLEGTSAQPGNWAFVIMAPQLIVDPANNDLYCLWQGTADTTDFSAAGYYNGELYGAKSTDGGATWTNYKNLTNTPSPGGAAGECFDEDYQTAHPYVVNDSIWITFIEDKDPGSIPQGQGSLTENPVHCWWVQKDYFVGIEEYKPETPTTVSFTVCPNPVNNRSQISYALPKASDVSIKLFSADGRLVRTVEQTRRNAGLYTRELSTHELANGTYFLILKTDQRKESRSLVVVH